jgi:hypothetical protein
MKNLVEVVGLMFDRTTVIITIFAIAIYFMAFGATDFWSALRLVTAVVPARILERQVRWLMMAQTRFKPRTGGAVHLMLWRLALSLDKVSRARELRSSDDAIRWRAVVMVGQMPMNSSAMQEVRKVADTDDSTPSSRAAAVVLEERSMSASASR